MITRRALCVLQAPTAGPTSGGDGGDPGRVEEATGARWNPKGILGESKPKRRVHLSFVRRFGRGFGWYLHGAPRPPGAHSSAHIGRGPRPSRGGHRCALNTEKKSLLLWRKFSFYTRNVMTGGVWCLVPHTLSCNGFRNQSRRVALCRPRNVITGGPGWPLPDVQTRKWTPTTAHVG
jgi:hypothetical protein